MLLRSSFSVPTTTLAPLPRPYVSLDNESALTIAYRSLRHQNPDLRAPGADDNGSGTSAVLELARAFAQSGVKYVNHADTCWIHH